LSAQLFFLGVATGVIGSDVIEEEMEIPIGNHNALSSKQVFMKEIGGQMNEAFTNEAKWQGFQRHL
jgi:hypothetical protein